MNHGIGHTTTDKNGRSRVQCQCGATLGMTRRAAFPLGGYLYSAKTANGKELNAASKMSAILEQFEKLYPEHVTAKGVTLNTEQRLYIIPAETGFSCLGFDVCDRRLKAVAAWCSARYIPHAPGTLKHYEEYISVMALAEDYARVTKTRCSVELTPQLVGLEGKRVEVTAPGEEPRRFYVGKSTGWLPCHLEIARRNSSGGGAVYLPEGATVRVVGQR